MTIAEAFSSFLKSSKWRKSKRKTQKTRPRSFLDVTDVIRGIEGKDSSYRSFDIDFQCDESPKCHSTPKPKKSRKSENKKSLMSVMCGSDNKDIQNQIREVKVQDDAQNVNALKSNNTETKTKTPISSKNKDMKATKRKSWMSLMCGLQSMDIENIDVMPEKGEVSKKNNKEENRKSWMSLVCGSGNSETNFQRSMYRDSGICLLSESDEEPSIQTQTKFKSKSCDDILESVRQCADNVTITSNESLHNQTSPSMNNLFRTTSIQENSLRLMRKRHRNVRRRRGQECDSCYSSFDFPIFVGSKSEGDLTKDDSYVEREVRFSALQGQTKEKCVSSIEVGRINNTHLKSWQIRRQRRDQKIKEKRESRNLELLLSKDFDFQERLIE